MLVLSRKEGERLVIGDNVIITVTRISGNRITLGIEAPRDVRVMRGELERHGSDSEKPAAKENEKQASHRLPASFEVEFSSWTEQVG